MYKKIRSWIEIVMNITLFWVGYFYTYIHFLTDTVVSRQQNPDHSNTIRTLIYLDYGKL